MMTKTTNTMVMYLVTDMNKDMLDNNVDIE